jgi:hypothetical protein
VRASARLAAIAIPLAGLAIALGSCGGDAPDGDVDPVGEVRVGSVAQLAQCRDWSAGSREERLATIEDIREQVNLQDSAVKTPELSDDVAYEVLDNTCAHEYAEGFRLYKLYARATGFSSFAAP